MRRLALLIACCALFGSGCSLVGGAPTSPHEAAVRMLAGTGLPKPVGKPRAVISTVTVTVPDDTELANKLLAESRPRLSVESPRLGADFFRGRTPVAPSLRDAVTARGMPLLVPDPKLVGEPSVVLALPGVSQGFMVAARYPQGFDFAAGRIEGPATDYRSVMASEAASLDQTALSRLIQGAPRRTMLVSIGGNIGVATTRAVAEGPVAVPATLVWEEAGTRYTLTSARLDPDQLAMIAATMVRIEP
jgi:hypothetical protein